MAEDNLQPGDRPANAPPRPDAAHITTTVARTAGYTQLPGFSAEPPADTAAAEPLPAGIADRIAELSRQATALERMLRQVRGVLYAIFDGGMLDALPADADDSQRHNMATLLLDLLRDRLDAADAGGESGNDLLPYLGKLNEGLDALASEVRHAAR